MINLTKIETKMYFNIKNKSELIEYRHIQTMRYWNNSLKRI